MTSILRCPTRGLPVLLLLLGAWPGPAASAAPFSVSPLGVKTTPAALAQILAGCGVTILDVRYRGTTVSAGTFTGGSAYVGIDAGVVLSSGSVSLIPQKNSSEGSGVSNGLPGDADLEAIAPPGSKTYDATSLDIEFLTSATTITVDFVFASEEYNEYVNSFNDIFAFFVNGKNIAVLPDGVTPITINNVNGGGGGGSVPLPYGTSPSNSLYFISNSSDSSSLLAVSGWSATRFNGFELDGLTVVFTVTATLSGDPYHVNHMKVAVADMTDSVYDSDVFIRSGSFSVPGCIPAVVVVPPPPAALVPGTAVDSHVHGFPNPFRPGSGGPQDAAVITFVSVPAGGRIRIYTLAGDFVIEVNDADHDGRILWDGRNASNRVVGSGVYDVVASSADGRAHSRCQIAVIR